MSLLMSKLLMVIKKNFCQVIFVARRAFETQKCNLIWHSCSKLATNLEAKSHYDQNFHIHYLLILAIFYNFSKFGTKKRNKNL